MKKVIKFVFLAYIILTVLFFISIPIVNDITALKVACDLKDIPMPENTEYVEKVFLAGKLSGNGNGMQYYGAILLKSDLSLDELQTYYKSFSDSPWNCVVKKQTDQTVVLEHGSLELKTDITEDNYYILSSWGTGIEIYEYLDLRGH